MAGLKTQPNDANVEAFLSSIPDDTQREEARILSSLMQEETGSPPVMYGTTILGFGQSTITYANGKTQAWFAAGFSPRKGKFSLYIVDDADARSDELADLGKYTNGKACIWVKRLSDIDLGVLRRIVRQAAAAGT